jgi:outer membrane protein TolC
MAGAGPDGLLARADEMRRIALGAYREGAIPLIQVLDAARAWGDTRLTFYRTLYAQHQMVLALIVANGGDLFTAPLTSALGSPR